MSGERGSLPGYCRSLWVVSDSGSDQSMDLVNRNSRSDDRDDILDFIFVELRIRTQGEAGFRQQGPHGVRPIEAIGRRRCTLRRNI